MCTSKATYCIVSLISLNHAHSSRPLACCIIQCAPIVICIKPYWLDVISFKKCLLYLPLLSNRPISHIWFHWVLHHLTHYITNLKQTLLIVVSHINLLFFTNIVETQIPVYCCIFKEQQPFV